MLNIVKAPYKYSNLPLHLQLQLCKKIIRRTFRLSYCMDASNSIKDIQGCSSSVQSRMCANKLKLHPDITEFIVCRNKRQLAELAQFYPANILDNRLVAADTVKNLEVKFDS